MAWARRVTVSALPERIPLLESLGGVDRIIPITAVAEIELGVSMQAFHSCCA